MARAFKRVDREQLFLMPPSMLDWLPDSHPVWLLIEVVKRLDLSRFEERYRLGAAGREPFPPSMLVTLVLWCSANKIDSSRRIERACLEDISCRVICGGLTPDHTTISKFVTQHRDALSGLFGQVLALCGRAGLVELGTVALDGTKVSANAAAGANRTAEHLRRQVDQMLTDLAGNDETDDDRFGDGDGFSVPDDLADPATRGDRVQRLIDAHGSRDVSGGPDPGSGVDRLALVPLNKGGSTKDLAHSLVLLGWASSTGAVRVNMTDVDSALLHGANGGWLQGYNCQVVTTANQIVLAVSVSNAANDYGQFGPMLDRARENLVAAGIDDAIDHVLADAGYSSEADLEAAEADPANTLIAVGKHRDVGKDPGPEPGSEWAKENTAIGSEHRAEQQRRAALYQRFANGELSRSQAKAAIGISDESFHRGFNAWQAGGVDAVPVRKRKNPHPRPTGGQRHRWKMRAALAQEANRERYKKRGHAVETYFGQIKGNRGFTRFARRGLPAVEAEWSMAATMHNVDKLMAAITNLCHVMLPA